MVRITLAGGKHNPSASVLQVPCPLSSFRPACCRQAQAGIHEGGPGEGVARFAGWHVRLSLLWLSFPLRGNDLCKPLDSGLRHNDGRVDEFRLVCRSQLDIRQSQFLNASQLRRHNWMTFQNTEIIWCPGPDLNRHGR